LFQRKNGESSAATDRFLRHAEDYATGFILCDGLRAGVAHFQETLRAITTRTGHDHTDAMTSSSSRSRAKEHVHNGPMAGNQRAIVCSGLTEKRMELAISALELGAVEVITKPKLGMRDFLHESAVMLLDVVWSAANARVVPRPFPPVPQRNTADFVLPLGPLPRLQPAGEKVIAVGASTGGTEAIRAFLQAMPLGCPGIVIVQHMPEMFTRAFAERLNKDCVIEVKEAAEGDRILNGRALIAPGNHQSTGGAQWCELSGPNQRLPAVVSAP
jgi:chemotaxis response regulator CheB